MDLLWKLLISNAMIAGCLFVMVLLVRRWVKNPAVLHLLLLLVLIKLITPAVWYPRIDLLTAKTKTAPNHPAIASPQGAETESTPESQAAAKSGLSSFAALRKGLRKTTTAADPTAEDIPSPGMTKQPSPMVESFTEPAWSARLTSYFAGLEWTWSSLLLLIWGTGTMVCFFVGAVRIICFQRLLKQAQPAPAELQQRARTLGTQIGLKSVPQVDLISGAISPLLWAGFSRARIILPAQLLQELNDAEVETLLLHELAHYRRGDHWVRLLELLTTGLYWWYPVVWWGRREIRVIEETCCDAWVIWTEPDKRRAYAEVLVKATGFVSQAQCIPAATGMGTQRILEQRLTSIMCDSLKHRISRRGKFLLVTVALLLLSLAPLPGTSQAETKVAEKPNQLPSVEEILGGYRNNLQRLLPLGMTYRIMAQENMNCITRDRLILEALRNIQKADRSEIKIDGKIMSEDEYQMRVTYSYSSQEMFLDSQLTPEVVQKRLSETVVDQRYFWTDGRSFHQRRPYQLQQKNTTLEQGPVWPAENLNEHYDAIELISWSNQNQPPLRRWYGRKKNNQIPQGEIGNDLKQIHNLKTTAPLGLKQFHWTEELSEYSLDACLTKPPHRYRVVGRENRDGKALILVEYLNEPHEQSPEKRWRTRVWVDPSQGYLPLRIEWGYVDQKNQLAWGLSQHAEVLQVKQVDGSFYPTRIRFQEYTTGTPKKQEQSSQANEIKIFTKNLENLPAVPTVPGRSTTWDVLDIHPHQQIAPETLALRFPEETVYDNKIDGRTYTTGTEQPLPEDPEPPEMVHLFSQAPPLQVTEWLDGNTHQLKDFEGKVVVLLFLEDVLNYDFSGMSPEIEKYVGEIKKMLLRLHQKYADKEIIFLEIYPPGTSKVKIREFHQNRGFKTLAAIDQRQAEGGATNQKYHGIHVAPTCFLLSRKGRVVFSPEIYDSIMAEDYFQHTARKLSISLDEMEKLPEDEAIRQSLRIMEYIISEQIDKVLVIQ
ncbi:M56 family metallopeptidase [Gimesia maris]|uniref:Methicillin resistance mecR1 protein n=1 Tax=Gimesia maris TaxID=122 RepID=A0ABX5YMD1_9PLAN|nr:M56 family metallopeptidase [Gimesia maris]EDL59741.1 peptidase M56, BlaR1 [Gimesia maris DSM 8797]QEG16760.1 Methicillin resistance mecR1 protein [Gimesia maris]